MALADTLVLAEKESPSLILDYATLTGACITAITSRYCGIFSNRAELHPLLKRCGQRCGERVWPFPMGEEFMDELDSNTADFKQCSPSGSGDHILAASFSKPVRRTENALGPSRPQRIDAQRGIGPCPKRNYGIRRALLVCRCC